MVARGLCVLGGLTALVGGVLAVGGWGDRVALGAWVGHGLAQALTASWVVGTAWSFERPLSSLRQWTGGLWPLRFAVVVIALALVESWKGVDTGAFVLGLMGTHVAGQALEVWTLETLTRASKSPPSEEPPREG